MKIGFWSPVPGAAGVSSNVIAMTFLTAEVYNMDCCLMQTTWDELNGLQRPLLGRMLEEDVDNVYFSDLGIDAIMRHVGAGDRSQATIEDCCVKIGPKVTYVPTTQQGNKKIYEESFMRYADTIPSLLDRFHKVCFFDIKAGISSLSMRMLKAMDYIVYCMPQNPVAIEYAVKNEHLNKDNCFYLFGCYDEASYYNVRNLRKMFSLSKKECGTIPYCTEYRDSLNQSSVKTFMTKNAELDDKENCIYSFIESTKDALDRILKGSGVIETLEERGE